MIELKIIPMKRHTIRQRVIDELANLPFADDYMTARQLKKALGDVKMSSLSSILRKMVKRGEIYRQSGYGPRGGYGYRRKTVSEAIYERIARYGNYISYNPALSLINSVV